MESTEHENPCRCGRDGITSALLAQQGSGGRHTYAQSLIEGFAVQAVLADKARDANKLLECLRARGIEAVIPPKVNRLTQRQYEWHVYEDRNLVERFFNRIKQFRRVAT
jgi:transposase